MEHFGEKVLHDGLKAINPSFYEEPWVGKFPAGGDHFWVAFGPAGGPAAFGKKAHQTVSLYDVGLDVFVNVEQSSAIRMLKKRMDSEKQKFIGIVARLPEPFHIEIVEFKTIGPRKSRGYRIATLEAGTYKPPHQGTYGLKDPASSGFDHLERLLNQIALPYFSLRRRIDRKRVLELSRGGGKALVAEVVNVMKAFHPLVEFING